MTPRPHQAPVVRLLEPGARPLAPLRYALGRPQQLTAVARGTMEIKRGAQTSQLPFPTLTTPVRLIPGKDKDKDKVEFVWLKGSFEPAPGQPDTTTGHILTALEGSGGVLVCDARGVISQVFLRAGPSDKAERPMMENRSIYATEMGKGILSLLEVPLPEEPIGLGARWQVERVAVRGPLSIVQVTTFTLVKRTGAVLELSYRFGGRFDEGCGLKENELKLAVTGGGTCSVDLTLPLPFKLEDELQVDAWITGPNGIPTQQSTRVRTTVESK